MEVERDNQRFLSAPRPLLATEVAEQLAIEKGEVLRTLIHMDEPDHKAYRAVAATWFQPNSLRRLEEMEIRKEHKNLSRERKDLQALLKDEGLRWDRIVTELEETRTKFGGGALNFLQLI